MQENPLFPGARRCALIGMVHLAPLPGSPGYRGDVRAIVERAVTDARILLEGGADALLVENMGDVPYRKGRVDPETIAAAALAAARVGELGAPFGVQLLAAANREALGVAIATGATFLRVEGFAYAHVADEGWIDACAGELARARAALRADVRFFADVKKKHASHAVTSDLSVSELAKGAAFCGADAVIVTGTATGEPTREADVAAARAAGLPVIVGSGVRPEDAARFVGLADAVIVGSALKDGGDWRGPVALDRVRNLARALDGP
jgi:membrane complex biogenesis BtpA family protein